MYNQEKRMKLKESLIEKINDWVEMQDDLEIYFGENTVALLAESVINMLEVIKESNAEQELNAG